MVLNNMKLNRREKYSVYAAAVIICIFVLIKFIVFPVIDKRERVTRAIQVKTKILEEMIVLKSKHDAISYKADLSKLRFAKREKNFTLFSLIDSLAGKAAIKDHIVYMKPSTSVAKNSNYKISSVEIKLQNVTLKDLISYLYMVETTDTNVFINRLSISKAGGQEDLINAVLKVETIGI
jgi:general secretion pathway protein M